MPQLTPSQDTPQETTRRLENLARVGTVTAVKTQKPPRCRVKLGDNTTDWLPWMALRAAGKKKGSHWWPPAVGEQCLVISPGGDMSQGMVILGAYSDDMDAPANEPGMERTNWDEDNWAEYREGQYTVHTKRGITFEVDDNCALTIGLDSITARVGGAVMTITQDRITTNVDLIAQGVSVVHHKHTGVTEGGDISGEPTT